MAVTVVALLVYRKTSEEIKPEVMAENVWWGRSSERTSVDAGDSEVRPFQINITNKVQKFKKI